jgi:hypothetical protein
MGQSTDFLIKILAEADGLIKEAKASEEILTSLASKAESVFKGVSTAAVGLKIKSMIGDVVELTKEFAAQAEMTEHLAAITGTSARTMEEWSVGLRRAHTSGAALAHASKTLAQNVVEANDAGSDAAKTFRAMDIDLTKVANNEELLRLVVDRLSQMEDGSEKTARMTALLGRGALDLALFLKGGTKAIDESAAAARAMGLVLSEVQRRDLTAVDDAFDDLDSSLAGFKTQVAAAFAPSIKWFTDLAAMGIQLSTHVFVGLVDAAEKLGLRFRGLFLAMQAVGEQLFSTNVLSLDAWKATLQRVQGIDAETAALIKSVDADRQRLSGLEAGTSATRGASVAVKELAADQERLGKGIVSTTQILVKQREELQAFQRSVQEGLGRAIVTNDVASRAVSARISKELFDNLEKDFTNQSGHILDPLFPSTGDIGTSLGFSISPQFGIGFIQEGLGKAELANALSSRAMGDTLANALIDAEQAAAVAFEDFWAQQERNQEGYGRALRHNGTIGAQIVAAQLNALVDSEQAAASAFEGFWAEQERNQEGFGRAERYNATTGAAIRAASNQREIDAMVQREEAAIAAMDAELEGLSRAEQAYGQFTANKLIAAERFKGEAARLSDDLYLSTLHGEQRARMEAEFTALDRLQWVQKHVADEAQAAALIVQIHQAKSAQLQQIATQFPSFWAQQLKQLADSNVFTLSTITTQFSAATASWIRGTGTFTQFWESMQQTMLQSVINFGIQFVAQQVLMMVQGTSAASALVGAHTAMESAKTAATATAEAARLGITTATNKVILAGAFTSLASIGAVGDAAMATMAAVVVATAGVFAAMATALALSIVGAPMAPVYAAAAAAVAGAGGAAVAAGTAAIQVALGGAIVATTAAMATPFAAGGIAMGPTLGMVAEAGSPEMMVPLDSRGRDFLNSVGIGGGSGGMQQINLYLDERKLSEMVVRGMPAVVQARLGAIG